MLTGLSCLPNRADALSCHGVTGCSSTHTRLEAVLPKLTSPAGQLTQVPMEPCRTPPGALSTPRVTGRPTWTVTLLPTATTIEPWITLLLTLRAVVARFAKTGPVLGMAAQGMFQNTVTLLRAADTVGPPGTRQVAEASVQPRGTQAGSIETVAAPVVGAVTPPPTVFPKVSLWATILTELALHPWWANTPPGHWFTGAPILAPTQAVTGLSIGPYRTSLVADYASPSRCTFTAVSVRTTHCSVLTVSTAHTAVITKGII